MRKRIIAVALLSLVGAGAGTAIAADTKTYAGSSCVPWSGAITFWYSTIRGSSSGASVDCPAVQDGKSIASGSVRVADTNAVSGVECTLLSMYTVVNDPNLYLWTSGPFASAGNNGNWQQLNFGALPAGLPGYYFYSCSLPVGTSLATYTITENE